ncbi:hypothetical protein ACQ4PT_053909 [Festuca glaucescens]
MPLVARRHPPLRPLLPWLTLCDGRFLSLPDGALHRIRIPDDVSRIMSTGGMLFIVHNDGRCSLANPFSHNTAPQQVHANCFRHEVSLDSPPVCNLRKVVVMADHIVTVREGRPHGHGEVNKREESVDEKVRKLDEELARYKEQIRRTRPGPSQEAIKARAIRLLKHKRMYEEQRNMLYNQTYNLDQVGFAADGLKDAQQTMNAMKAANKELKGMMKTVKIEDIDNMQDEMTDLMDVSNEVQESLGRSYNIPDDVDEEELMGELDGLEADMEFESAAVPSYLQPDEEPDINFPAAPTYPTAVPVNRHQEDELGLPAVPRASLRS